MGEPLQNDHDAPLWAKSRRVDEEATTSHRLHGHLSDVIAAADLVLAASGDDQLRTLGLEPEIYRDRFRRCVRLAAALHDLGKANDHFQAMLDRTRQANQGLRHEWVSLLIVMDQKLREWLLPAVEGDKIDWSISLWSITGHHPAYDRPSPPRLCPDGVGATLNVLSGRSDFRLCLDVIGQRLDLKEFSDELADQPIQLVGPGNAFKRIMRWYQDSRDIWEDLLKKDVKGRGLVAAVKGCLIAADLAGSALPREVEDPHQRMQWISRALIERKPTTEQLAAVVSARLGKNSLREFQKTVAASTDRVTFVRAGCGSGKTLAAYAWHRDQGAGRRLYICYPTTGTATEGYRDYIDAELAGLKDQKLVSALFHGRAEVDRILEVERKHREGVAPTPGGNRNEGDDGEALQRIAALDAWATPVVACTVDTVLGLVQNNRRGLFAWPALAQSSFVFDEIHAYDDRLFGALLRFLRELPGANVLLMTASLPSARYRALKNCLGDSLTEPIAGPKHLEELPRYQRQGPLDTRDVMEEVKAALAKDGGRVLWVCNTVDRAVAAYDRAIGEGIASTYLYHSRFKYEDRVVKHRAVIDAFQDKSGKPALAICTQVSEMSLDISATLLVTELAPVPSLIQRLGRLNRHAKTVDPKPFIVIRPVNALGEVSALPYTPEDLLLAEQWLEQLGEDKLSQLSLSNAWESLPDAAGRRPALIESAWLDGGPTSQVLELRESSPGVTVLCQSDSEAIKKRPEEVPRYTIPMPPPPREIARRWSVATATKLRGVPIVEDAGETALIDYCPERGAQWRKQQ
jgi:CRISPR-associated endonuclease/helicase Cas3